MMERMEIKNICETVKERGRQCAENFMQREINPGDRLRVDQEIVFPNQIKKLLKQGEVDMLAEGFVNSMLSHYKKKKGACPATHVYTIFTAKFEDGTEIVSGCLARQRNSYDSDSEEEEHTCKSCNETMSDKSFKDGKMCCDKPMFHDDHDSDSE